jgi:UDP-N-acetylglucosamine 2-epimerase (non-hydrolysing)
MIYQKVVTNRQLICVDIQTDLNNAGLLALPTITISSGPKPVGATRNRLKPLMKEKTVVTITGIRPDFIRMSEVFKQLDEAFHHIMIHTGQHYDTYLSDTFFRDLNIRAPDYHLEAGIKSKNHYEQLGYLSVAVIECIKANNIRPDLILFLGDSNTSAVALPLKKEGYAIGHIEAGMRSGDRNMLEEINRTVCDVCSDVFFVYHDDNRRNLEQENIQPNRPIHVVGNTIVEVCVGQLEKLQLLSRRKHRNLILMDIHRPENFNSPARLQSIFAFANVLLRYFKLPVKCLHFKRLLDQITIHQIDIGDVEIIPLLSYPDYLSLVYHSKVLLSDSGTGQEEPALLSTPVIVPRDFTERPQSYASGCSIKFNVDGDDNVGDIIKWINEYERRDVDISWLGEGNTAELIVSGVAEFLS